MPGKKIWSWGGDDEGLDWRRALSDDKSAYLEVQAGLFRNQETYAFLEPQQRCASARLAAGAGDRRAVRATPDAVLNVGGTRRRRNALAGRGLNVTRALAAAALRIVDGARAGREEPLILPPSHLFDPAYTWRPPAPFYSVEVARPPGRVPLPHTEGRPTTSPPGRREDWARSRPAAPRPPPRGPRTTSWSSAATRS